MNQIIVPGNELASLDQLIAIDDKTRRLRADRGFGVLVFLCQLVAAAAILAVLFIGVLAANYFGSQLWAAAKW